MTHKKLFSGFLVCANCEDSAPWSSGRLKAPGRVTLSPGPGAAG
jgi:hypothetical protein